MVPRDLTQLLSPRDREAILYLEESIAAGNHWYVAMLEAINIWETTEENHNGRIYRYLIANEAFDWLLLAERLLELAESAIPEEEREALLCRGRPPLCLDVATFKKSIGSLKYRQFLNYFYGITVEEALVQTVTAEVTKEWQPLGLSQLSSCEDEVYRRIYGKDEGALWQQFCMEKALAVPNFTNLTEIREFTYWLFRYRVSHCDKAKVASDTKKGLDQLRALGYFELMVNEERQRREVDET
jgi:hypothetical protein